MDKSTIISNLELASYNKDFEEMETIAKDALQIFPEESFAYNYLIEALLQKEIVPYQAVELSLIKIIQLDADNLDAMVKLAQVKEAQGDEAAALSTYKAILEKDPTQSEALNAIGAYKLYVEKSAKDALHFFDMSIASSPSDVAIVNKAIALTELKQYLEALQIVRHVSTKGFDEKAYVTEIRALEGLGQYKSAVPLYDALVAECPENASYHYRFGELLIKISRYSQAMLELETAVELFDPPSDVLLNKYYELLMTTGSYEKAEHTAKTLIERSPETLGYYLNEIKAIHAQDNTSAALSALDHFEQKAVNDEYYLKQATIERAFILADTHRFEEAKNLLSTQLKEKKGRQHILFALGKIHYQHSELPAAYYYLYMAEKAGHPIASEYITCYLQDYLLSTQKRIIKENESAQKEAAQQPFLLSIQNKLWAFKDMNSRKLQSSVEEVRESVKTELQKRMMFFTDKGGFALYPNGKSSCFIYSIETVHKENVLDLKITPLDGLASKIVRLGNVKGKAIMLSEEEGEMLLFVNETLTDTQQTHFNEHIDFDALEILGPGIKALK